VYRRYASLFFVCGISAGDNELATLEIIHRYVEVLDRYFGNVSKVFALQAFRVVICPWAVFTDDFFLGLTGVRVGLVRVYLLPLLFVIDQGLGWIIGSSISRRLIP